MISWPENQTQIQLPSGFNCRETTLRTLPPNLAGKPCALKVRGVLSMNCVHVAQICNLQYRSKTVPWGRRKKEVATRTNLQNREFMVSQVIDSQASSTLLLGRIESCGATAVRERCNVSTRCRLQVGETADCKSALRQRAACSHFPQVEMPLSGFAGAQI